MDHSNHENHGTRERLLLAAGEVFAQLGYRNTTVRDICRRANSNVAAVNYYFGDKEKLYAAVVEYADRCANEEQPIGEDFGTGLSPELKLYEFIRRVVGRIFGQGRRAWYAKLVTRELVDPSPALEPLLEATFRPQFERLVAIVREIAGPEPSDADVRACAFSVVGQCSFFHHARAVIGRLDPRQQYRPEDIDRLADHVTRFSIAALRNWTDTTLPECLARSTGQESEDR